MYTRPTFLRALLVAVMMLASSLGLAGLSAGETTRYDLGQLEVITGTVNDTAEARHKLDEQGDFVAIRFGGDSWFAVVYGTNETPNFIHLRSFQLRYLGGATITNDRGRVIDDQQPLPVAHIAGQALPALVEFKDEGYTITDRNGTPFYKEDDKEITIGAGNGLFDFRPVAGARGIGAFNPRWAEPIQKVVDLRTAWTLRFDRETDVQIDRANRTAEVRFSLSAYNLSYVYVRGGTTDEVLDEVTITFRLTVRAVQKTVDMPWYEIEVDRNDVRRSQRVENRTLDGTAIEAEMKYDHLIDGWDYQERDNNSRLMLTTYTAFATFIPGGVARWMRTQFLENYLPDAAGALAYETDYEIDQGTGEASSYGGRGGNGNEARGDGDNDTRPDDRGKVRYRAEQQLTDRIQRVATNRLDFADNWDRVARFEWVSNVTSTVNGTETNETLRYQIHAMQPLQLFMLKHDAQKLKQIRDRGVVRGIVVQGGYIYPAGDTLFHDPSFEANTVLADLGGGLQAVLNKLAVIQIVELVAVGGLAVVLVARSRRRLARLR